MSLPTRQGFEQIAIGRVVGAVIFGVLALRARRNGRSWQRHGTSAGILGGLAAIALVLGYTLAINVPTPAAPLTARFATNPVPDTAEVWTNGRALFQKNCAVCHGSQGLGDGPAALTLNPRPVNLQVHVPLHAPGEIEYWISEGIIGTAMPAWKTTLSDTERWTLVRFLQALASGRA